MKRVMKILPLVFVLALVLSACGGSQKTKIVGVWKGVVEDKKGENASYLEFDEDRVILRNLDDDPVTTNYTLTESQANSFILEIYNPETQKNQFLLEGFFKNKNTIEITRAADVSDTEKAQLVRVKNIVKDMEVEKEKRRKKEEAEEKKRLAEEKKEKKLEDERIKQEKKEEAERRAEEAKEEKAEKERLAKENADFKKEASRKHAEEKKKQTASASSLKENYRQRADRLENRIHNESPYDSVHDIPAGYYGGFTEEWDELLNEVWGVLRNQMSSAEFEQLKAEQNAWIQKKEKHFAGMPSGHATERGNGVDYLASETRDRTYYLINNYLK